MTANQAWALYGLLGFIACMLILIYLAIIGTRGE